MICNAIPPVWPFRSKPNQGPDLADEIDACERQLRAQAKLTSQDEQTPLFDNVSSGVSTPQRRLSGTSANVPAPFDTSAWNRTFDLRTSTDETPPWIEYTYRPLRTVAQLLYDLVLGFVIALVWILDRWYRWLFVTLPPALYFTAYRFIMREEHAPAGTTAGYLVAFLVLLGLTMVVAATSMSRSRRSSLLSNR